MTHLPTYTWKGRNAKAINAFVETLSLWNEHNISVIDIGPGGVAERYAKYLPEGDHSDLGRANRMRKTLVNMLESGERDKEGSDLVVYEPSELYSALNGISISNFYVVDKYQKVLDSLNGDIPNLTKVSSDIESGDITFNGVLIRGNAVVALNVLHKCRDMSSALRHITNSVVSNGYLLINAPVKYDLTLEGFIKLRDIGKSSHIYRKGDRPDKSKEHKHFRAPPLDEEAIARFMGS